VYVHQKSIVARFPFDAPDRDSPLWPIKSLTSVRCLSHDRRPDYADNNLPLCSPLSPFIIQLLHFLFLLFRFKTQQKFSSSLCPLSLFLPLPSWPHLSDAFLILFFMEQEKSYKKRKRKRQRTILLFAVVLQNYFDICS
jgi:hypothetical protein